MFPVNQAVVQLQSATWLNRIMENSVRSLSGGTPAEGHSRRSYTPLRPNAGLVQRMSSGRLQPIGGRPQTVEEGAARPEVPQPPESGSLSARPPTKQTPSPDSVLSPLYVTKHDAYSEQEEAIVDELNVMRSNPAAYAKRVAEKLRVKLPFLTNPKVPPMNVSEMTAYAADVTAQLMEAQNATELLEQGEKKEIATLREQWAAEDAERAKKKGKAAPAPKKGAPGTQGAPQTQEEAEVEREETIKQMLAANDARRAELVEITKELKGYSENANAGVKVFRALLTKLESTPTLPPFASNRGLSLAARDMCDFEPRANLRDPQRYAETYGNGDGPYAFAELSGKFTPELTVMWFLLSLDDPKRRGRVALLDKRMRCIGCGWRRQVNSPSVAQTYAITAGHYAEFAAIAARTHLPLQDVRRCLPMAKQSGTETVVRLSTDLNVTVVSPSTHPCVCGNRFSAILECPETIYLCGTVLDIGEPEPTRPILLKGETLAQRKNAQCVELTVILPSPGRFKLVLFARNEFNGDAYHRIGSIHLNAAKYEIADAWQRLPVVTADFQERKCCIVSPMEGLLLPDTQYTFHIIVPLSKYKAGELQRVTESLERASVVAMGGKDAIEARANEVEAAAAAVEEAIQQQAVAVLPLQTELGNLQKEQGKKKGKELDKLKQACTELEEKIAQLDQDVVAAKQRHAYAEQRLQAEKRQARQASALRRRYTDDKQQLYLATDRSKPLLVELSLSERRATLPPANADFTEYCGTVRTPFSGRVCIFVAGITAVTFDVLDERERM